MSLLWLLLFIPVSFALDHWHFNPIIVFFSTALAVVPLAKLMEEATENLSAYMGPTYGGLLNATMGNAPELIIGISALNNGLIDVLKGSIAGSIFGTLLFGLGVTMIAGGIRGKILPFDTAMVSMNNGLLSVTGFALIIPAVFKFTNQIDQEISIHISWLMLIMYLFSLIFTVRNRHEPIGTKGVETALHDAKEEQPAVEPHIPSWSLSRSVLVLGLVTTTLAFVSDLLTSSLAPAADLMNLSPTFAGVFLLAMVGNVPQYINSASFAYKERLTLAFSVNLGATSQLALLVAPLLVIIGQKMGLPMNLTFSPFELLGIVLSIIISRQLLHDNRATWLEGVMLVAVYGMLGVGFYYIPN
jgi:Ca2+:H+ antiporter